MDFVLHRKALILNFEEEIFFAENFGVGSGGGASGFVLPFHQTLGNFALQAAGEADQSAGVLGQEFFADSGLVVKTVQRSFGGDLNQVAVAFFILREHEQMVVGVAVGRGALNIVIVFFADVEFAADDGLDIILVGRVDEVHGAENIAVVGHCDRGHA